MWIEFKKEGKRICKINACGFEIKGGKCELTADDFGDDDMSFFYNLPTGGFAPYDWEPDTAIFDVSELLNYEIVFSDEI